MITEVLAYVNRALHRPARLGVMQQQHHNLPWYAENCLDRCAHQLDSAGANVQTGPDAYCKLHTNSCMPARHQLTPRPNHCIIETTQGPRRADRCADAYRCGGKSRSQSGDRFREESDLMHESTALLARHRVAHEHKSICMRVAEFTQLSDRAEAVAYTSEIGSSERS